MGFFGWGGKGNEVFLPALEETIAAFGKEALPVGHDSGNNSFSAYAAFKAQTDAIQVSKITWIYITHIFQVVQNRQLS